MFTSSVLSHQINLILALFATTTPHPRSYSCSKGKGPRVQSKGEHSRGPLWFSVPLIIPGHLCRGWLITHTGLPAAIACQAAILYQGLATFLRAGTGTAQDSKYWGSSRNFQHTTLFSHMEAPSLLSGFLLSLKTSKQTKQKLLASNLPHRHIQHPISHATYPILWALLSTFS